MVWMLNVHGSRDGVPAKRDRPRRASTLLLLAVARRNSECWDVATLRLFALILCTFPCLRVLLPVPRNLHRANREEHRDLFSRRVLCCRARTTRAGLVARPLF